MKCALFAVFLSLFLFSRKLLHINSKYSDYIASHNGLLLMKLGNSVLAIWEGWGLQDVGVQGGCASEYLGKRPYPCFLVSVNFF